MIVVVCCVLLFACSCSLLIDAVRVFFVVVGWCSLFAVCCLRFVVCCVLFGVCCLLCVVSCVLSFVVWRTLCVACCLCVRHVFCSV